MRPCKSSDRDSGNDIGDFQYPILFVKHKTVAKHSDAYNKDRLKGESSTRLIWEHSASYASMRVHLAPFDWRMLIY
jgi:hypothetical protein